MQVVFANNQMLVSNVSTSTTITTDPVAIGDNNQATLVANIHSLFNTVNLQITMQGSADGVNFVDQGPSLALTATGIDMDGPIAISLPYVRLVIIHNASAGGVGGVCFDIHGSFGRV